MEDSTNAARILEALRSSPTSETPAIQINFNGPVVVTPEVAAALVRILLRQRPTSTPSKAA
jgi:hypothetical protein